MVIVQLASKEMSPDGQLRMILYLLNNLNLLGMKIEGDSLTVEERYPEECMLLSTESYTSEVARAGAHSKLKRKRECCSKIPRHTYRFIEKSYNVIIELERKAEFIMEI
ncbi:hypothetical protein QAD02_014012 [Eretmocerus hayati]|uniref:Uncharacterized protein n=1 Tax=Eretmocerus hayati TaxID=131215 RepID=A0ACC2P8W9_9HYME|nr:hypothetical protein QAD02_014012 [Eretmocerus hayati]